MGGGCRIYKNKVVEDMAIFEIENIATINGEIAIAWKDGMETYIAEEELRKACPCANCQGEPDAMGRVVKPPVHYSSSSFRLVKMEIVGGYAVNFGWADGHATGIYSYAYLRELG